MQDDHYQGYLLPAGSTVLPNLWYISTERWPNVTSDCYVLLSRAISRNPSTYPDPDTFDPERFYSRNEMDPREYVFGFGRRKCPGSFLAMQGLFIAVSSFLWSYHIRPSQDPETMERDIYKLFDFTALM